MAEIWFVHVNECSGHCTCRHATLQVECVGADCGVGDAVLAELIESLKKGILGSNSQSMDCLCSVLVIVIHHSLVEDFRLFLLEQDTRTRVGHVR